MNLFNAREILLKSIRNRRETRVPFTPIQCFGLPLNETMPDVCRIAPPSTKETAHG